MQSEFLRLCVMVTTTKANKGRKKAKKKHKLDENELMSEARCKLQKHFE